MSSVDGRIDCAMTEKIDNTDTYYQALDSLKFDAMLEGRAGMTAVFDGIKQADYPPTLLTLNDVERMGNTVWLRYTVNKK